MLINPVYFKESIISRRGKRVQGIVQLSIRKLNIKVDQVLTYDLNGKINSVIDKVLDWISKIIWVEVTVNKIYAKINLKSIKMEKKSYKGKIILLCLGVLTSYIGSCWIFTVSYHNLYILEYFWSKCSPNNEFLFFFYAIVRVNSLQLHFFSICIIKVIEATRYQS